jgi:hypothetical protein
MVAGGAFWLDGRCEAEASTSGRYQCCRSLSELLLADATDGVAAQKNRLAPLPSTRIRRMRVADIVDKAGGKLGLPAL